MNKKTLLLTVLFAATLLAGCKSTKKMATENNQTTSLSRPANPYVASPIVYIYKTRVDYNNNVPVTMNEQRTEIVSYPDPSDLKQGDSYTYPTKLADGYLLDNRGINKNVAFLTYTYEEYAALSTPPSLAVLMEHIADKHPLTELYSCGRRMDYTNIEAELNSAIEAGFVGCQCITGK